MLYCCFAAASLLLYFTVFRDFAASYGCCLPDSPTSISGASATACPLSSYAHTPLLTTYLKVFRLLLRCVCVCVRERERERERERNRQTEAEREKGQRQRERERERV
jgi:hypothetical protein